MMKRCVSGVQAGENEFVQKNYQDCETLNKLYCLFYGHFAMLSSLVLAAAAAAASIT